MHSLSKREVHDITGQISKSWPINSVGAIKNLQAYVIDGKRRLLVGNNLVAIQLAPDLIIPHLTQHELLNHFASVQVDMNAVKFVCNGANIMRPGITDFTTFNESEIVLVKDQTHKKELAVCISLVDDVNGRKMEKGVVLNNVHHIGDVYWETKKTIRA
ncbi:MAG TPA: PUA domain-containing protein [Nitrososphaeraceae archaeon]|nr:PUA domain-containing protein [Nitrososphaeraceae archaeon]